MGSLVRCVSCFSIITNLGIHTTSHTNLVSTTLLQLGFCFCSSLQDDEGSSSPAPHAAPSHQASPSTPTKLLGPSPRNGTPKKANPRGLHPTTSDVNIAHLLEALETKDIVFHLVSGFGIRAADSNGKSDPYCIVHLGSHMLSSRVVEKSLEPTWNETFLFHVADAQEAIKGWSLY